MARKKSKPVPSTDTPTQTDQLATGIALGERLAGLEAGFARLEQFVQTRVRWLVLIALSALMQIAGAPLSEKFGALLREIGATALRAIS
jgi:hypothetical protein